MKTMLKNTRIYYGFVLISLLFLASCSKDSMNTSGGDGGIENVNYKALTINSVKCDTVEAVGGIVTPVVDYSYIKVVSKNGGQTETKMTTGANLTFSVSQSGWKVDENGNISVVANQDVNELKAVLNVNVTIGQQKAEKVCDIIQRAGDDRIIDASYCMLPIWIEEHECAYPMIHFPTLAGSRCDDYNDESLITKEQTYISQQKDGKINLDWKSLAKPGYDDILMSYFDNEKTGKTREYVAAAGTQIRFHGGEYAQVCTYLSGKKDTTVIAEATFKTETEYVFLKGERYTEKYIWGNGQTGYRTKYKDDDKKASPKSSVNGNVWTISGIGNVEVEHVTHTLTATSNGLSTSFTLFQNDNFSVETMEENLVWGDPEILCRRAEWPDISDYPVGSNPKWPKEDDGAWCNDEDTRDLHPDGNRFVDIRVIVHWIVYNGALKFYSGSQEEKNLAAKNFNSFEDDLISDGGHGFSFIATANVKLKDGTTKQVKHVSEWPALKKPQVFETNRPWMTIELPMVENAAEDFQWTITINFNMKDDEYYYASYASPNRYYMKNQTNYDEYSNAWKSISYKIWDRHTLISDWEKSVKMSGLMRASVAPRYPSDSRLGDIIDGKVNENSKYYQEYYQ